MRRSQAFALRDLLVILCLAAVALPLLAASLGDAVGQSAMLRCRTNLAALTRCVLLYTEQNRGYMPVYRHTFTEGYIRAADAPYKTAIAFSYSGKDPDTGLYEDVRNLGQLYVQRLARPPELFYCPGPMPDVRHTLVNYPTPWGSQIGEGSQFIRVGYMWNPWVKNIPGGEPHHWTYEDALVLTRHPRQRFLVGDLILRAQTISHPLSNSAEWNLAYPDGHVARFEDSELYGLFTYEGPGLDTTGDWYEFNTLIRPRLPGAAVGTGP